MSPREDRLSAALSDLGRQHSPKAGWQDAVFDAIDTDPPAGQIGDRPVTRSSGWIHWVMAAAVVVIAFSAGTAHHYYKKGKRAAAAAEAAVDQLETLRTENLRYQRELDALLRDIKAEALSLVNARSDEERRTRRLALAAKEKELRSKKKALRELEQKRAERQNAQDCLADRDQRQYCGGSRNARKRQGKATCDPTDPLCGI